MLESQTGLALYAIAATVGGGILSGVTCLCARRIGDFLGVIDAPDGKRKIHPVATPLVGGLAVMAALMPAGLLFALIGGFAPLYLTILAGAAASFLLGLLDDRNSVRPTFRLLVFVAVAFAALLAVPSLNVTFLQFTFSGQAWFLGGFALLFSLLCVVGLQNAINMADGKNGIVLGLALFWTADLALFAPDHLRPLLAALAVGLAVTLLFNLRGQLFLGDSGSYALSFTIALLAVHVYDVAFVHLPADLVALWFLIPVLDCLRLMALRIARGKSPFSSDRGHLHHLIYDRMPWRWGLVLYLAMVGGPGLLASLWPETTVFWAAASLCCYGVMLAWPSRQRQNLGTSVG